MANNSISSIRTALNMNLSAVSEIKEVLIGRTAQFSKFPACRHYLMAIGDADTDTATNFRTYKFGIDVIMPVAIQSVTKPTSEAEFQDAIDAVMDKLNDKWDDTVDLSIIEIGNVQEVTTPQGPANILTIVWQARTLITI